jgi:HlyD family secretion protein
MSKKQRIIPIAVVVIAVIVVLMLTVFGGDDGDNVILASGTVEAAEADLGFQIPGRIESILVREGDPVDSTAVLASLDRTELNARHEVALASLEAARAALTEVQTGFRSEEIAQGRAALRAAEDRLANATRDLERTQRLFDGGAVSRQALDHQETAVQMAEAEHESAVERLQILETGPRAERIAVQRAQVAGAEAQVRQIEATLENAMVRAPFSGTVSTKHREPGEIVQPGFPVLSIINSDDRWVRIYVREDQVGRISIGQEASLTADSYPDRTYRGRVIFIASEAEFTPRNVQTAEERVKLVYRVKVQITDDPSYDLKPGLAADVSIETETQ